ncbi:PorV/PorQ family protein [bacterium]|nr:PorV/PorQ family protein [bacterium]
MRKRYSLTISIFLILALISALQGQNPNLGTAGAQFLKIPIGARSAALGGAVTGMSADASALFWNPAGIIQDHNQAFHFSYIPWMTYFNITAFGYTLNLPNSGTLGIHALALGMEPMEITTEMEPSGTGQYFDSQDVEVGVSYARKLMDRFSLGFTTKYLYQRIWNETASGIAFDLGTQYNIDFRNTVIAMSMRNFGPDLCMDGPDLLILHDDNGQFPNRILQARKQTEAYPLPLNFQFGLAADFFQSAFVHSRMAIDAIHFNDNDEQIYLGLETIIAQRFVLRSGYQFNNDEENGSLGVGLTQRVDNMVIKLDYAYVLHEHLEDTRFISVDLIF